MSTPYDQSTMSIDERIAVGRAARERVSRKSHGVWSPATDRRDPVEFIEEQATTRVPELVPLRHGRMSTSAFAFYRGAALVMAADLASVPHSGLTVQLCGDAHLSNFGLFQSPERKLVFSVNDFDETLPGPFEWDVKRLVAIDIRPNGDVVVLGGKNGAGKSSVLDAITYALAGERSLPREPLRRGTEKGEVEIDLGEFRVRRTFTPGGGGTLTVLSPEGARYPSQQAMLDRLTGKLAFDPLAFAGQKPDEQAKTLRGMLGLDFTTIDAERSAAFAARTAVNRDGTALRARLAAAP